ncbi:MAG: hypothetical protein JXA49_06200, partial [Actinobacteria bacterium]|nr:hypothetical protein [Actinomycetota bacterium]
NLNLRFAGVGLLLLLLASTVVAPYYTVVQDPYSTTEIGGAVFAGVDASVLSESKEKKAEERDYKDWMILFANHPELSIYKGHKARVIGEVLLDKRLPAGFFFLSWKAVTHCEHCAKPISLTCEVVDGTEVPENGEWIEAVGEFELVKIGAQDVLVLEVRDYSKVPEPDDMFLRLHGGAEPAAEPLSTWSGWNPDRRLMIARPGLVDGPSSVDSLVKVGE